MLQLPGFLRTILTLVLVGSSFWMAYVSSISVVTSILTNLTDGRHILVLRVTGLVVSKYQELGQ